MLFMSELNDVKVIKAGKAMNKIPGWNSISCLSQLIEYSI
jgi:hypothetical protein